MKEFNLKEYNKLCAEFMNLIPACEPYIGAYIIPNDFEESEFSNLIFETMLENKSWYVYPEFDSDWNWIMEVVEMIENIADWELECFNTTDDEGNEIRLYQMRISISGTYSDNTDKKQAVVHAIWHFLNWYKENGGKK